MSRKDRRGTVKQQRTAPQRRTDGTPATAPAFALALQHHQAGRLPEAEAGYRQVLALQPGHGDACNNLAVALRQQGRLVEAVEAYQRVLALKPDFADALYNLAIALTSLGRLDEAATAYLKCLTLRPDHGSAHSNLGVVLASLGRLESAVAAYYRAIALNAGHAEAYINLGGALERLGRLEEARDVLTRVLALDPTRPEIHGNLGNVLKSQGRLSEAVDAYRRALALRPDYFEVHCNLLFCLNYRPDLSPAEIGRAHRDWADRYAQPLRRPAPDRPREPDRRLRVGYVSPDLKTHSVAYFFEPVLAAHDHGAVEVFCYADVTEPDAVTARLRGLADQWRPIVGLDDEALAGQVRADGIDILVDLTGHTGRNRLLAFARKPAPVQVTWLGYPNTTGLTAIDWRITDAIADPEGADALHSERLARLPTGFLCYAAPADAPEPEPLPAVAGGADAPITFGSFNNLTKVTPEVVRLWSAVLARVPGSRLIVKSTPLADAATCRRYADLFAAEGVDPARFDLLARLPSVNGHLGLYQRIDIALDTFPYTGTTTTCEALWMGVPVVTLLGDRHAARVSASLLARIGLVEMIARDEAGFVAIAAGLAADRPRLAALRASLRERMRHSPLCDAPGFTRILESAYRQMWQIHCRQAG